jgi:UDP-N-acetylglucosamine 2-epimerase
MADANRRFAPIARERSNVLRTLQVEPGAYAIATVHREANVRPERLARILEGLARVDGPVIFPAHPRARQTAASNRLLLGTNVALIDPLGYLDFAALASQARVILTDSGGLQKEAYWYGVPCVTLRPSTEWKDTVELGANVLVDDDPDAIAKAAAGARMPAGRPQLYGDGHAADRIAELLVSL